ncbi:MAG: 6-carboxytetrahydropterin synthase [Methanoregulaceae archaeon]|nr:6-carboxytetrahydropterin synthase [Methanoregulaceae archaeon]
MRLTRRVTFSSGHRYWVPDWSESKNREVFGQWANPYNHGHNYILDVTASGPVDPVNGMVVNIKRIDDVLKRDVIQMFDQRSINDEVPAFRSQSSTLENLLNYFAETLTAAFAAEWPGQPISLTHLRLEEMPTLWAELDLELDMMTLTRTYEFAAAHRLQADALPVEENLALYGKCNNPAGHGHNYVLEVTVAGKPDPTTGMMVDLGALDSTVHEEVVDRYDHKHLNLDLPEFAGRVTTSEVVAQEIWDRLDGKVPAQLYRVRLWETARNAFEVTRS